MSKIKILIVSLLILAACKPSKGPSNEQDQSVKDQSASKYSDMLGLPELPVPKTIRSPKKKSPWVIGCITTPPSALPVKYHVLPAMPRAKALPISYRSLRESTD